MAHSSPTPDPTWKGLPSWLIFVFFVIGPPATLVSWLRATVLSPWWIALLVLYYIVLFLLRFTGKIWNKVEDIIVTAIAQWLTTLTKERTFRYYHHYCQHLVYEYQVFDVKGLSTRTAHDLELEQVFVDLEVCPVLLHEMKSNPVPVPQALQGVRSLWEYLLTPGLANPHLVIVGAPGSGKTTLLKHVALRLAQPRKDAHIPQRRVRHHFPILLFLRDHASMITSMPDYSLAQAVIDHMQRKWQQAVPVTWIRHRLEKGGCFVLLDGLDEVADPDVRRQVVTWVQNQIHAYGQNRFVLTSRPYGYRDNPLDGVTTLDVQPFAPQQIAQFIRNWYLANELKSWGKDDPGMRQRSREGAEDLMRRLRTVPALLALAVNPLLLTMIATVHRYRSSLPGKRVALYAEICEVFLGKRAEARGMAQDLSPAQKQQVLQSLAYTMMTQNLREISSSEAERVIQDALLLVSPQLAPADFLHSVENTSGLLLERNPGSYGFAHLTFQEYLTAVFIKERGLEPILLAQVKNSWWSETIRLYCAQSDASTLILACLADIPPTVEALTLAIECDEEKLQIQPQAQARLTKIVETGVEDPDPVQRRVVAEALVRRRMRQMVHLQDEIYIDTSLVTCAEYQLFLDEARARSQYHQPDHWKEATFPPGTGMQPVLGVRRADARAFCQWLTERDTEQWHYRLPLSAEKPLIGDHLLSVQTGYWGTEGFLWAQGQLSLQMQEQVRRVIDDVFDHDLALALVHDRGRDLDHALAHVAYNRVLNRALNHALDLAHDRERALDLDLDRDRDLDLVRDRALDRTLVRDRALDRALAHIHALALDHVHARARDRAVDIYITLLLLHARIQGTLPAYEGVLLIKERKMIPEA